MTEYDVLIVGGGPGGLGAAVYAARGGLKTGVFEKGLIGGQIALTADVENYPGFAENMSGFELIDKLKAHADKFGPAFHEETVEKIELDGLWKVVTTDEDTYRARTVIYAAGASPRKLDVPGEKELTGRGVSYCATCDGALYRGKKVAVIGGGDSAVEEALFLTRFAETVYIVHRRDQLRAVHAVQNRAFKNPKLEFVWDSIVKEIQGDNAVEQLLIHNVKTKEDSFLKVDGVFIYVGILPNNELVKDHVKLDDRGFILAGEDMSTGMPGVFAAGDIVHKVLRQVITATSDGAIAAFTAEKWIDEHAEEMG